VFFKTYLVQVKRIAYGLFLAVYSLTTIFASEWEKYELVIAL
jgi:hypothetical protein